MIYGIVMDQLAEELDAWTLKTGRSPSWIAIGHGTYIRLRKEAEKFLDNWPFSSTKGGPDRFKGVPLYAGDVDNGTSFEFREDADRPLT